MRIIRQLILVALMSVALSSCQSTQPGSTVGAATQPDRISPESVVKFMSDFERLGEQQDFSLWSNLIHEKAIYRLNDGDFSGKASIKDVVERTWATYRTVENGRFYLTDIQVVHTDHASASATYTYNWEWTQNGRAQKVQGRATRILVLDQGRLQVAYMHLSPFPSPMLQRATTAGAPKQ